MSKLVITIISLMLICCHSSDADFDDNANKLKIVSIEDVKKWDHKTKRRHVVDVVSMDAVLAATMHRVIFKAKEGGAYSVDFFPDKDGDYLVVAIFYHPKYPDEMPLEAILREK